MTGGARFSWEPQISGRDHLDFVSQFGRWNHLGQNHGETLANHASVSHLPIPFLLLQLAASPAIVPFPTLLPSRSCGGWRYRAGRSHGSLLHICSSSTSGGHASRKDGAGGGGRTRRTYVRLQLSAVLLDKEMVAAAASNRGCWTGRPPSLIPHLEPEEQPDAGAGVV